MAEKLKEDNMDKAKEILNSEELRKVMIIALPILGFIVGVGFVVLLSQYV